MWLCVVYSPHAALPIPISRSVRKSSSGLSASRQTTCLYSTFCLSRWPFLRYPQTKPPMSLRLSLSDFFIALYSATVSPVTVGLDSLSSRCDHVVFVCFHFLAKRCGAVAIVNSISYCSCNAGHLSFCLNVICFYY